MAKSKNHTAHNQTRKAHRQGITKVGLQKYSSLKGVDAKFLRNRRRSIKMMLAAKAKKWRWLKCDHRMFMNLNKLQKDLISGSKYDLLETSELLACYLDKWRRGLNVILSVMLQTEMVLRTIVSDQYPFTTIIG